MGRKYFFYRKTKKNRKNKKNKTNKTNKYKNKKSLGNKKRNVLKGGTLLNPLHNTVYSFTDNISNFIHDLKGTGHIQGYSAIQI